eukprot:SAG31_NODE_32388_length_356_cov_1.198444_1_plen_47_part_10
MEAQSNSSAKDFEVSWQSLPIECLGDFIAAKVSFTLSDGCNFSGHVF